MFAVILIYWHSLVFISMYFKGLLYNICFVVLFLISWILKNTDKWEHRHCFKYFVASTTELNCDMVPPLCASKHSVWNLQLSSLANYLHCYFFLAGCVLWSLFCTPARVELRSCHALVLGSGHDINRHDHILISGPLDSRGAFDLCCINTHSYLHHIKLMASQTFLTYSRSHLIFYISEVYILLYTPLRLLDS